MSISRGTISVTRLLPCFVLWLSIPSSVCFAAGTSDTLSTEHNGVLIGEIKELDRGKMIFDTDAAGKINLKWDHITYVRSPRFFRVELSSGMLYFGSLDTDSTADQLIISLEQFIYRADMNEVVGITRIKTEFWDRLELSVSAGLNFQKGSGVGQTNLTFNASQKRDYDLRIFKADFVVTFQKQRDPTERHDVSFTANWNLGKLWFSNVYGAYQKNTELGLVSRFIVGGGGGKYFAHRSGQYFYSTAGLFATFEQGRDSLAKPTHTTSLEGLLGLRYALFQYDEPEIDLETYLNMFPTLPNFDRLRVEFDITLKWEIVKDFTWNLTFYQSYDSKPPTVSASQTDYGINFGLGWEL